MAANVAGATAICLRDRPRSMAAMPTTDIRTTIIPLP
jgi:hypothetical protein